MKTKGYKVLLLGMMMAITGMVAGCGSGGSFETSGVLTMDTPSVSNGVVTAKATYSVAMPNIPVEFEYYYVGQTTNVRTPAAGYLLTKLNTVGDGSATFNFTFDPGRTEGNVFYVNAKYTGLSSGWKSVVVPQ